MKPSSAALPNMADPHLKAEPRSDAAASGAWPIDLVHLTRQTFGDKRLETELLRLFLTQSEQIEKSLSCTVDDRAHAMPDMELLHMLSGSARVIGATEIAALAGRLEGTLRSGAAEPLRDADRRSLSDLIGRTGRYIADLLDQA